jgi:hypothetical protein
MGKFGGGLIPQFVRRNTSTFQAEERPKSEFMHNLHLSIDSDNKELSRIST